MEFVRGERYVNSDLYGGILTFLCESVQNPNLLVFEVSGQAFSVERKRAESKFIPYVEPIKCEEWGFFKTNHDGTRVLCHAATRDTAASMRKVALDIGSRCSDVFYITGTIK